MKDLLTGMVFGGLFMGAVLQVMSLLSSSSSSSPSSSSVLSFPTEMMQTNNKNHYEYPDRLFGFIHIAKTAGSSINGELAARYERVCGNKGYSYDFYEMNNRTGTSRGDSYGELPGAPHHPGGDRSWNRGNIPSFLMKEIGFQDCDLVSIEHKPSFWVDEFVHKKWSPLLTLELHLPCREPVDHLMSMCNFLHKKFDCHAASQSDAPKALEQQVKPCLVHEERFDRALLQQESFSVKCFDAHQVTGYVQYMGQFLQHKRYPSTYNFRPTNQKRNHDEECIWSPEYADLKHELQQFLIERYDMWSFCDECMGTSGELPLWLL